MNEQETSTNTGQQQSSESVAQQVFSGGEQQGGGGEQQQAGGEQQQQQQQPTTTQAASLTPEQLRELVASTAREAVSAAVPQQQQPQLSQDQINQMLNVFQVGPQHAQRLLRALGQTEVNEQSVNEVVGLLNELLDAKSRQAVTMAAVQLEALRRNELAGLRNQLTPVLTFAQQQQEQQLRQEFLAKYPDMQGWEPMLEMVYQQMVNEKRAFKDKNEAFTAVYDRAKAVLAKLPNAQGNGQQQQQRQPNNGAGRRQMSTVSTGGQVGAANRGQQPGRSEKLARGLFGG